MSLQAATDRMNAIIQQGRASAEALIAKVYSDVPVDRIVRGRALRFRHASPRAIQEPQLLDAADPGARGLDGADDVGRILNMVELPNVVTDGVLSVVAEPEADDDVVPSLVLDVADQTSETLNRNALNQIASRANIPPKYLRELVSSPNAALRDLGLEILSTHYRDTEKCRDSRYLVRSVDGDVRGFLSDSYRRLDSRPLLETFFDNCQRIGAVPVEGTSSDTRVALKAYMPRVYSPIDGEPMLIGLEWGNSDFGNGSHSLRIALLRLWCKNGCTFADAIRNVHLGRKLEGDIAYSQHTYQLDTEAARSAMGDVIDHYLAPSAIETTMNAIAKAHDTTVNRTSFAATIKRALSASDAKKVLDAYDNDHDVEHLPAGQNLWRASNAISWIAGRADGDRKLAMTRLAGKLIEDKIGKLAA